MASEARHILILSLLFPPDRVSTAHIVGDLAADLVASNRRVTVVTTTPHYNPDEEAGRALRPWLGPLVRRGKWKGARVFYCLMPAKRGATLHRILSWLFFHVLSTAVGATCVRHVDLIFAPSPPLSIGVSAWLLSLVHRAPFVYNVQEIYPDIAVKLGRIREGPLLQGLRLLERFVYRVAAAVTVIGPRFKAQLCRKRVPEHKVHVIPNFVDVNNHQPLPKENRFSRRHGLSSAFVVSYAGNLGPAQGLDTILDACTALNGEPSCRFLFAGEGILRDYLNDQIASRGLAHCLSLPYQDTALMPEIYATSDVSLVPLAQEAGFDAIPSKVYRIMACARAVIAQAERGSDLATLVHEAGAGWVVRPGDVSGLVEAIREAMRNQEALVARGASGRRYVMARYTRQQVTARYRDLFDAVVETGKKAI